MAYWFVGSVLFHTVWGVFACRAAWRSPEPGSERRKPLGDRIAHGLIWVIGFSVIWARFLEDDPRAITVFWVNILCICAVLAVLLPAGRCRGKTGRNEYTENRAAENRRP